ncbi:muscarinic acetylcholine receptor M2-like [Mustelus asterias]
MVESSTEPNETLIYPTFLFGSERGSFYKMIEVVFIVIVTGLLSLLTIIGNILVIVSIKVNRHLQTINNYFLFSLACADLIIGVFSMNLYTTYIVFGYWPMGPVLCDLWLALDYVACNASSMNLLVISFDRYFCVTKPLSYPVWRTTKMAGMMIAAAWVLSFILFVPATLFWHFIVGQRTVGQGECYAPFFSNPTVTFVTAIAGFYLPVFVMAILYVQISRASKSRVKDNKMHTEVSKYLVPYNLVKGKIMEHSKSKVSNGANGLAHITVQNDKTTGEMPISNRGQGEENEPAKESTSSSVVPSNQQDEWTIQETQCFNMDNSKLSIIKIGSTLQNSDECSTTARMVPGNSSKIDNCRKSISGKEIITEVNAFAKKKEGAVSREDKVTKTVLAILLAVIITWSPYFIMVLINTFCPICIPDTLWTIGFWLAYINSTVNPACYALCNGTFKKTFKRLLLCQYKNIRARR